jgi:hypothetical protein
MMRARVAVMPPPVPVAPVPAMPGSAAPGPVMPGPVMPPPVPVAPVPASPELVPVPVLVTRVPGPVLRLVARRLVVFRRVVCGWWLMGCCWVGWIFLGVMVRGCGCWWGRRGGRGRGWMRLMWGWRVGLRSCVGRGRVLGRSCC